MRVVANVAYLVSDTHLLIVDIRNPAASVLHGSYDTTLVGISSMDVAGSMVYVSAQRHANGAWQIIDVSCSVVGRTALSRYAFANQSRHTSALSYR